VLEKLKAWWKEFWTPRCVCCGRVISVGQKTCEAPECIERYYEHWSDG
jgi:hypothetical protein